MNPPLWEPKLFVVPQEMDEAPRLLMVGGKFVSHGPLLTVTMILASHGRNADPSGSSKEQIFRICCLSWLKQVMRLGIEVHHVLGLRPFTTRRTRPGTLLL